MCFRLDWSLYELLTGYRAVPGENVYEVMYRIANEDIRLPGSSGTEIDDQLASLLYKALARDPEHRFCLDRADARSAR